MDELVCMLCKNIINTIKYNIDQNYTKYSNLLLRTILEGVFEHQIVLASNLHVCVDCSDLLNELDLAESSYKSLRQKVLGYLDYSCYATNKSNAYCQTDVFIENVLEYDVQGKNKIIKDETIMEEQNNYPPNNAENETEVSTTLIKKFECHFCLKKFVSKNGVTTHVRRLHGDLNSKNSENPLIEKQIVSDANTYLQSETENNVNQEIISKNHISFNDGENSDENSDCSKGNCFEIETSRKGCRGRKKKHPDILKPYQCTSCPKTWKTLGELKSHLSAHSNVRPFICEICGQAYKHKTALDIHVGMHNGIYPFRCVYCKKSFTQKGALQRHMPIHTGETPYQCDLCGKRFVHHTSFNIHQLSHSGQKDYKCAQCGLALLSGSHLKRHMRVHTGERNYACNLCDKRFAERYNLASHQKLHEKPTSSAAFKRNHRCQICGITYNRRLKLDEHMARDHQKMVETNVPYIQQLLTKNDTESIWSTAYNNLKMDGIPETSY